MELELQFDSYSFPLNLLLLAFCQLIIRILFVTHKILNKMNELLIQIIVDFLLVLLVYLITFWKSYSSKKGENAAIIEDIGVITKTIEKIKSDYVYENQSLKSKLDLFFKYEIDKFDNEKSALFGFYDSFIYYFECALDFKSTRINESSLDQFETLKLEIEEAHYKVSFAKFKAKLFIDNERITELIQELDIKAYELQGDLIKSMILLKMEVEIFLIESKGPHLSILEHKQLRDKNGVKTIEIMENYHKKRMENLQIIYPLLQSYVIETRRYLSIEKE